MSIFSFVADKYADLKIWIVQQVRWAEGNMSGKTGAEKRAAVVARLDDLIKLPFWLEWVDGPVIGFFVDKICNAINILTDHSDWSAVSVTDEQVAAISELPEKSIKEFAAAHAEEDINARFEALCSEYGLTDSADDKPVNLGGDKLSANFTRAEFACKCGCGADDVDPDLVDVCQTIRDAIKMPLRVNSGVRCVQHNLNVGGVPESTHTKGKAADLSCAAGAEYLFAVIRNLFEIGKLPKLSYCLRYPSFVHVDVGPVRTRRFDVKS